tara:strand:+ start:1980 stop:2600 length:621 start_codon:yes stop_codon:yes gene_type:complete
MVLLTSIFPGLRKIAIDSVPIWEDDEKPWSILSSEDSGLISQLMRVDDAEDGIFIHPEARIGEFVQIEGPCYIGANAEIRHSAYLRKGSWICEGAVVGHSSEIKNSILLPNSKAPHFNYVGDSILGFGVNIGAGVKLSNVRNDRREVRVALENGEIVDSGLRKLGALIGDNSQLGCNVVTNPGALIIPNSMISPNESVSGWFGVKS